jgi:hypothetical protein
MPEIKEHNTELQITMPRREFIRKSLIASGGVFVGMTTLGNTSLPELTKFKKPKQPSSGKDDKDDRGGHDDDDRGGHDDDDGGKGGWGRW